MKQSRNFSLDKMMNKELIAETLRLIIAKSEDASKEAITAIRALDANSPIIQIRLNRVADLALNDHSCEFTPDEREMIAAILDAEGGGLRDKTLPIRLTRTEYLELRRLADEAGSTMSEFIRSKVFGAI